jgi:mRNA interferase MazF
MNLAQGEIYWVAFPPSDGREQMGRRPALIAQGGVVLQSLPTIWVVPITSNLRAAHFPGTICIDPNKENGLTAPSVLLVFQLRAIDKRRLIQLAGKVSPPQLDQVLSMIDQLLGRQP